MVVKGLTVNHASDPNGVLRGSGELLAVELEIDHELYGGPLDGGGLDGEAYRRTKWSSAGMKG